MLEQLPEDDRLIVQRILDANTISRCSSAHILLLHLPRPSLALHSVTPTNSKVFLRQIVRKMHF